MSNSLRTNKVWLLTKRENDSEKECCCSVTFRKIYKLAIFELNISTPSVSELQARRLYNKTNLCFVFDRDKFDSLEEALWSPVGQIAIIKKIPVK